MIVEVGNERETADFLAASGICVVPPFVGFVIRDGSAIVAAAFFNNYHESNIDMSVIFSRRIALTRGNLRALFYYPFVTLGINRVSVQTRATNMSVRKQIRRLGFEPEGKHPGYYGKEDAMSYGMLRSKCKWL